MVETLDILIAIAPFIIGLVAVLLIPGKEKILKKETTFRVEVLTVVYLIALINLAIGFYFFLPLFTGAPDLSLINIFNGGIITIIALGIMGLNYRNYSLVSQPVAGIDGRVESAEVQAIKGVEIIQEVEVASLATPAQKKIQLVQCPKCGHAIEVELTGKPVKMSCPNCGIEGMVQ